MKKRLTARACGALILSSAILLASAASSQATSPQPDLKYTVVMNVASLGSDLNGPFSLDLQLAPGSDNVTNTVTLTNFAFVGGSVVGSPNFTMGGETGSMTTSVTLTNSNNVDNEIAQAFSSGVTQIIFSVDQTVNPETGVNPTPDQFNVFIDDNNSATGFLVPTNDSTGNNTFISSTIIEGETINNVATHNSTAPDAGVTAVPEPGSAALLLLGVAGLISRRKRAVAPQTA